MSLFNRKVFGYTFATALPLSLFAASEAIPKSESFDVGTLVVAGIGALLASVVVAALTACYRHPIQWLLSKCRIIMVIIAKKAVRYSLAHATVPVECSGIFERDGEVVVRVQAGRVNSIVEGAQFKVYESTGNQLWGVVQVVDVRSSDCDCTVYDRANPEFWEGLERRMKSDTLAPSNVYFVRNISISEIADAVEQLLDEWR